MKTNLSIFILFGSILLSASCRKEDNSTPVVPTTLSTPLTPITPTLTLNDSLRVSLFKLTGSVQENGFDIRDASKNPFLVGSNGGLQTTLTAKDINGFKSTNLEEAKNYILITQGYRMWYSPQPKDGLYYVVRLKKNNYVRLDWIDESKFLLKRDVNNNVTNTGGTSFNLTLWYGNNIE